MSTPLVNLLVAGLVLAVFQALAAIPWVSAFDGRPFRRWITDPKVLAYLSGATFVLGLGIGGFINKLGDVEDLTFYGRFYGTILHLQLVLDFAILAPRALLLIAPKTGAVAIAAYREALRQPMFWLILIVATMLIVVSMVIPYFTLGDDYKLMKQVGFDLVMLCSALFGLLTASISVNEEIEGRTAITVISKPVSRRQFFMGKYLGILLACWVMTMALGVVLTWALWVKPRFDPLDDVVDPMPFEVTKMMTPKMEKIVPTTEGKAWAKGMGAWFGETAAHHIGLARIFGQVMILLGICTALATRVQFIVNLVICFGVFLIGNLSPIMVHVTEKKEFEGNTAMQLVRFIAQAVNAVFPSLDAFDMGPAIIRDMPLSAAAFLGFVGTVLLYALLYTGMTILGGLVLFEDRDLA